MGAFRLGINMAGAVSAGAYTAGVLDFLIEALDAWYAAKQQGQAVPMHEVSIDVFSGASAGGMCAAIASVMVQGDFDHIHDPNAQNTSNRFYESWVNKIDITRLLGKNDLKDNEPVYSLLDCSIIDEIAEYALVPGNPKRRAYISPNLTLFLTLTNLSGIPYSLNDVASGSLEESTLYHADRLRFETVQAGQMTTTPIAKPLPLGKPGQGSWPLLQEAAKATGAFPLFLKPRQLTREISDYCPAMWESIGSDANADTTTKPAWPNGLSSTIDTINVDGGVIDNDPFDLAHDHLASLAPASANNQNPRKPLEANRAVITISPFPMQDAFTQSPAFAASAAVMPAMGKLLSVFISQSRFFGESLGLMTKGTSSRFVIAPSDTSLPANTAALQCAALGAFGGFFERSFRAHDYQLGRRNCQQFLRYHFVLPVENPIIAAGLEALGARKSKAIADFRVDAPDNTTGGQSGIWIPIIPLCGDAVGQDVPSPARGKITQENLREIVRLIDDRMNAVVPRLLQHAFSEPIRLALKLGEQLFTFFGRSRIEDYLRSQLGDSIE
jgi:hypothetical protein